MKIRVALVDDKAINRNSIRSIIKHSDDIEVVMECVNGIEFLEQLKQKGEEIDVVLMDLEMPELDGIETIFRAKTSMPHIKFIVLTVFEDSNKIFDAIKAGAHGYLLKEDGSMNLIDSIKSVFDHGAVPMSPIVARKVLNYMKSDSIKVENNIELESPLSTREMEVLKLLISGKNYKKIGELLFISPFTVRRHVNNIYEKLHVKTRSEVINIVNKHKWL
jgi:DNA-binding NarL/FixJ family response regulator